jgi:hypothetical protein
MLEFFQIIFSSFFSLTIASHFLGGSFTYILSNKKESTDANRLERTRNEIKSWQELL